MKRNEESGGSGSGRKEGNDDDVKSCKIWDCGSPLYDAYELVAVSHIVERHFMILPHLSGSRINVADMAAVSCSEKALETTSENARRSLSSSVLGFFSKSMWKRKNDREIKQKAKRQKTGISKFFAWKKQ